MHPDRIQALQLKRPERAIDTRQTHQLALTMVEVVEQGQSVLLGNQLIRRAFYFVVRNGIRHFQSDADIVETLK